MNRPAICLLLACIPAFGQASGAAVASCELLAARQLQLTRDDLRILPGDLNVERLPGGTTGSPSWAVLSGTVRAAPYLEPRPFVCLLTPEGTAAFFRLDNGTEPMHECYASGRTSVNLSECLDLGVSAAEANLTEAVDRARRRAAAQEQATGQTGLVAAVDRSLASWRDFRDALCAYMASMAGGAAPPSEDVRKACNLRMAQEYARYLGSR